MPDSKRQPRRWHKLDNTANLFPVITSKRFTNVFRLSVLLHEDIVPDLLQRALETVLPRFAALRVRLRHGVFWHYLEANPAMATVHQEADYPCRYIDPAQNNQFLFRVSYYENRINLEVFHVLTDGTGALQFLQALCCQYLLLAHPASFTEEERARQWFAEHAVNTVDDYATNYAPAKKASYHVGRAYRLKGEHLLLDGLGVIHAHIGIDALRELCHQKNVTVTQYLAAAIAWGVYTQLPAGRPPKHPLNIFLPVNLRNLFDSHSALNFFSSIYITLPLNQPNLTFDALLADVKLQFEERLNKEAMLEKISYTVGGGSSAFVRMAPLPLKNAVLRVIYESSASGSTLGFSNLGQVKFPPPFQPFVQGALFLLSSAPREPFKCTAISYNSTLTLSLTSCLKGTGLQKAIVRQLSHDGLSVTVTSNGVDYESM